VVFCLKYRKIKKCETYVGLEVLRAAVMKRKLATFSLAGVLLGLFDPEDGGDMFLRNAG
jgi:hypothetical protein